MMDLLDNPAQVVILYDNLFNFLSQVKHFNNEMNTTTIYKKFTIRKQKEETWMDAKTTWS